MKFSARAPRTATKIAVKKGSDVIVRMCRPELYFSMYTFCFFACFCVKWRLTAANSLTNLNDLRTPKTNYTATFPMDRKVARVLSTVKMQN